MKPSEILRGAASEIRKYGWAQFVSVSYSGGLCMTAAIRKAAGMPNLVDTPQPFLDHADVVRRIAHSVWGESTIRFNNHECESPDDAIAALEIAADIAECEGV